MNIFGMQMSLTKSWTLEAGFSTVRTFILTEGLLSCLPFPACSSNSLIYIYTILLFIREQNFLTISLCDTPI